MKAANGQHIVGIYGALSPCLNAKLHYKFNQQKLTRPIYPTQLFWLVPNKNVIMTILLQFALLFKKQL